MVRLLTLGLREGGIQQSELKRQLGIAQPRLSKLMEKLGKKKAGWIQVKLPETDRRVWLMTTPSVLGDIQPDHWLPEYTSELLNVLNVLGMLIDLEPTQAELLKQACSSSLISEDELKAAGAFESPAKPKVKAKGTEALHLFEA